MNAVETFFINATRTVSFSPWSTTPAHCSGYLSGSLKYFDNVMADLGTPPFLTLAYSAMFTLNF